MNEAFVVFIRGHILAGIRDAHRVYAPSRSIQMMSKNRRGGTESVRVPLQVKRSAIDGQGVFALAALPARRKLGEMTGAVIGLREARRRARMRKRIAIVELPDGGAIDGSQSGNLFRFTNHSCAPNAFIRICRGRVEIWSRRAIGAGEEITCDYSETQHGGKLRCRCGQSGCRGFL